MRKQNKIVLYPAYFDSTKTRKDGRRIPKTLAVPSPRILEIKDSVEKLGFEYKFAADVSYSKTPWLKTGFLLVKKNEAKEQIIKKIAKQLAKMRSTSTAK